MRIRAGACLTAVLAAVLGVATSAAEAPAKLDVRVFEIRHKVLADAAEIVGPLVSPEGSLTLQPRLRTMTVQDRADVLDRIAAAVASFDVPPRNVEVTLTLFLGSDRREAEAGRASRDPATAREVRGVGETLGDFTKWSAYEPLGSQSIAVAEGAPVTANLSPDYRVVYEVESVDDRGVVKFRAFALQRAVRDPAGNTRWEDQYATQIVIPAGRQLVVGAAQAPGSSRALFLKLQARPR